jgi:transposase-like protein
MARPRCPRCTGNLFYNAEDSLPRFTCLACGRSFVPSRDEAPAQKAA